MFMPQFMWFSQANYVLFLLILQTNSNWDWKKHVPKNMFLQCWMILDLLSFMAHLFPLYVSCGD